MLLFSTIFVNLIYAKEFDWRQCEGETIHVLGAAESFWEVPRSFIPEFEKLTGIKIVHETLGMSQLRTKVKMELASGKSSLDVFTCQIGGIGRALSEAGLLEPLEKYIKDSSLTPKDWNYEDFAEACRETATLYGKVPVNNLVVEARSQLLFYRKDLFEKYDVKVPETLSEMEEAAKKLYKDTDGDGKIDIYGITLRGQGNAAVTQVATYIYNFGGTWFDEEGLFNINSPEAINAIEFYGRLLGKYGPSGPLDIGWYESAEIFGSGRAAMQTEINQYINRYEAPDSPIKGKVGVRLIPAGPGGSHPQLPTASYMISKTSKHKKPAWLFIMWLNNKENTFKMLQEGVSVARKSAWQNPNFKPINEEWAQASWQAAQIGRDFAKPPVPFVSEARDIIAPVIVSAIKLESREKIKTFADEAVDKLNKLLLEY